MLRIFANELFIFWADRVSFLRACLSFGQCISFLFCCPFLTSCFYCRPFFAQDFLVDYNKSKLQNSSPPIPAPRFSLSQVDLLCFLFLSDDHTYLVMPRSSCKGTNWSAPWITCRCVKTDFARRGEVYLVPDDPLPSIRVPALHWPAQSMPGPARRLSPAPSCRPVPTLCCSARPGL